MTRKLLIIALMLSMISLSFARDYYVSTNGNDGGDGSSSRPWRSLSHALRNVPSNQGHTIILSEGTFTESGQQTISNGVNIKGAGIGKTILTASSGFFHSSAGWFDSGRFLVKLTNNSSLSDLTLSGQNKQIHGGMLTENATNVSITNVRLEQFYFTGARLADLKNSTLRGIQVYDCSWGSSGWANGAFVIDNLSNVQIIGINIKEINQRSGRFGGGYGIKCWNHMKNVTISEAYVDINPFGLWNNGQAPNISLEAIVGKHDNFVITNSFFNNNVSIGADADNAPTSQYAIRFLNNRVICNGNGYPIELMGNKMEIAGNYLVGRGNAYGIMSWEDHRTLRDWYVHNNVFHISGGGWPSSIVGNKGGFHNINVVNNTIHIDGHPTYIVFTEQTGDYSNLQIRNNVVYRTAGYDPYYYPKADAVSNVSVTASNNIFYRFPTVAGTGNRTEDPRFTLSGAQPFPYYEPVSGGLAHTMNAGARLLSDAVIPVSNNVTPTPVPAPQPTYPTTLLNAPVRINAGGKAYTSNGVTFMEDIYYYGDSKTAEYPLLIAGTEQDALYQSERWGSSFSYKIPIKPGNYDVTLHFAEIYWDAASKRVLNASIEGQSDLLKNFDIFKEVGKTKAVQKQFKNIAVSDSLLEIALSTVSDNAKISAIEVTPSKVYVNTPPAFVLDKSSVTLEEDATTANYITVQPDSVPVDDQNQTVTYSISPAQSDLVTVSFDAATRKISLLAKSGKSGTQSFVITANDGQSSNNTSTQTFSVVITPKTPVVSQSTPIKTTFRINVGGPAFTTDEGVAFEADSAQYLTGNSQTQHNKIRIARTVDDSLYQAERYGANFGYSIPVPNGVYTVTLHFAEMFWEKRNKRVFDVNVEGGDPEVWDLDIFDEVGDITPLKQVLEEVTVSDGKMDIQLSASDDVATLSAIEIVPDEAAQAPSSVNNPTNTQQAIRINCGSDQPLSVGGMVFAADNYFDAATSRAYTNTKIADIKNTTYDDLYRSERYAGVDKGSVKYSIPVTNGTYKVVLHFAEIWWGATGGALGGIGNRYFDVSLEGTAVQQNLDILKTSGSMSALVQEYNVTVTDGKVDLTLTGKYDRPKISAIEVLPTGAQSIAQDTRKSLRINAGATTNMMFDGKLFLADNFYGANTLPWENKALTTIEGTNFDQLYLTERVASKDMGMVQYEIPVENGQYEVFLHFAEIWFGAPGGGPNSAGQRMMNVKVEGANALSGLDLIKTVGTRKAYVKKVSVNVTDGMLNIELSASVNRPKISAIEVLIPSEAATTIAEASQTHRSLNDAYTDKLAAEDGEVITLAPNPASTTTGLLIENDYEGEFEVTIFDGFGKLCKRYSFSKKTPISKYKLDLSELKPGLYVVSILQNGIQKSVKLWKTDQ